MGFFGKIKKGFKAAAAAHKKDDFLVQEMARILREQGYPVTEPEKKRRKIKEDEVGPEKYSFHVTTADGQIKIKTESQHGILKASSKLNKMKKGKVKFTVKEYVHNDGGKLSIRKPDALLQKSMSLM